VLPDLELTVVNVKGGTAYDAEAYIVITNDQLTFVETHREAAVTTATRLEEHDVASLFLKPRNRPECVRSG
jgi:HJR/Mrr/RecB family endonuclease